MTGMGSGSWSRSSSANRLLPTAREKLCTGESAMKFQPLEGSQWASGSAKRQHPVVGDAKLARIEFQQPVQPALVENPVPHWPGIDVDKPRIWIPANAAASRRPCCGHSLCELRVETEVERAAVNMLAVISYPEGRAGKDGVRHGCAIGREDGSLGLA